MGPANVLEFEAIAKTKLSKWGYDYIATGVEEEVTLRANRAAFNRVWLRRRAMVDVTHIDTSLEILGQKLDYPILLDPTGGKDIDDANADEIAAEGAFPAKAIYCVAAGPWMQKMHAENRAPVWWSNSVGLGTQQIATNFARRSEDAGCSAIILTMDYEYTPNRDRYIRNHYDWGYHQPGPPQNGVKLEVRNPAVDGMLVPSTPSMTWDTVSWLRSAAKVPICVKGILRPDDADRAIKAGAQAIVVSNHGGRALDGGIATLDALPAVVKAVNGRVPVLMDSGVRRGDDILKALALGAKAVLIGRPYVWGLTAFGKEGLQRVIDILRAELVLAMGLAGVPNLAAIDSSLVCRAWEPPAGAIG
jgi:isopentenyl diphosphate isomerase/L-lactate dehydrogenase-like FMN-dependent dehydrogenase